MYQQTTDEILKEYESLEELDESVSVEEIPDDTVDQIIASIDERDPDKNPETPKDDVSSLLEAEKREMKVTIEALKAKLDESEENSLKAQIEISSLTEQIHQLEKDMQIKDDQNSILLGEKNSLEMKNLDADTRISRINTAIQKIYNEKEDLKVAIDKQKTTINLLQNKSPVPPTLDTKTNK